MIEDIRIVVDLHKRTAAERQLDAAVHAIADRAIKQRGRLKHLPPPMICHPFDWAQADTTETEKP